MKNRKGFTIVELVIVIAVIAILAAVLIPTFSGVVNKANESSRTQEMTNALKVVLAGNAETGALAANTVFVTKDGYYAVYNGNKLGSILPISVTSGNQLAVTVSEGTTKTASMTAENGDADMETTPIKSVILPYNGTAFDIDSCKALYKLFGGADDLTVPFTATDGEITVNGVELNVYSNVDLAKGMFVLSPTN